MAIIARYLPMLRCEYVTSLVLGAVLAFSAPGINVWLLAWVGLVPCFIWLLNGQPLKKAFLCGTLFGWAFHAVFLIWLLALHPMDWLGFPTIVSLAVATATWLTASISGGLAFGLLAGLYSRYFSFSKNITWLTYAHWLIVPVLWLALFYAYQINALWFPWALLDYTQTDFPLMRAVIGTTGNGGSVAAIIVATNLLLAQAFFRLKPQQWSTLVIGSLVFLAVLSRLPSPMPLTAIKPLPPVVLYQGGVDIGAIKTGNDFEKLSKEAYLNPIQKRRFTPGTLLVLPEEGIVPGWVNQKAPLKNPTIQHLQTIAERKRIAILTGISSFMESSQKRVEVFNSTILLQPKHSAQFYNKIRLVPFGEVVPYVNNDLVNAGLETFQIPYQFNFRAGQHPTPLSVYTDSPAAPNPVKVGSLICFELIYPELAKQYKAQGIQLITNSSNLGWFHHHPLMNSQFIAIGRVRALETGLPLAITSNSAPSAFISPDGTILQSVFVAVQASLTLRIPPTEQ